MKKKIYKNHVDELLDRIKTIDFLIEEENKDLEFILFLIVIVLFTKSEDIKSMFLSGYLTAFIKSMRKTSDIDYLLYLKSNLESEFLIEIENSEEKNVDYYKRKIRIYEKRKKFKFRYFFRLDTNMCFMSSKNT